MKLLVVVSTLAGGGAERQAANLTSLFASAQHTVSILTLRGEDVPTAYPVPREVHVGKLGIARESNSLLSLAAWGGVRTLRRTILSTRPDAVIAFANKCAITVLAALAGTRIPVFVRDSHAAWAVHLSPLWRCAQRALYPFAACVVAQTGRGRDYFRRWAGVRADSIPNPVPAPAERKNWQVEQRSILAIGRLDPVKGFDLLIDAFAIALAAVPGWQLTLAGQGKLRDALAQRAANAGVERAVSFTGWLAKPEQAMSGAEIFALTSHAEGFPNALCESMAFGLPAVAVDCPTGPAEILRHGTDGLLVEGRHPAAFADALIELMRDRAKRMAMGARATEVVCRFHAPSVAARWITLIAAHTRTADRTATRG